MAFGSHRAREAAERLLRELPNSLYSFRSNHELYKISQEQLQQLQGNKRVVMKVFTKLPAGEWFSSWK